MAPRPLQRVSQKCVPLIPRVLVYAEPESLINSDTIDFFKIVKRVKSWMPLMQFWILKKLVIATFDQHLQCLVYGRWLSIIFWSNSMSWISRGANFIDIIILYIIIIFTKIISMRCSHHNGQTTDQETVACVNLSLSLSLVYGMGICWASLFSITGSLYLPTRQIPAITRATLC